MIFFLLKFPLLHKHSYRVFFKTQIGAVAGKKLEIHNSEGPDNVESLGQN